MKTMRTKQYRDLMERLFIILDELDAKGALYAPSADSVRAAIEDLRISYSMDVR